jgi:hypothetical protein
MAVAEESGLRKSFFNWALSSFEGLDILCKNVRL